MNIKSFRITLERQTCVSYMHWLGHRPPLLFGDDKGSSEPGANAIHGKSEEW